MGPTVTISKHGKCREKGRGDIHFGNVIKAKRKRLKLNQREMAGVLGVCPSTVSNWEQGLFLPFCPNEYTSKILRAFLKRNLDLDKTQGAMDEKIKSTNPPDSP